MIKTNQDVIEQSLKFLNQYATFNEHAVKKYNPLLYKHVLSKFQSFEKLLKSNKDLFDSGSRIWNYNNICLSYDKIPKKSLNIISQQYKNIKEQIESTFIKPINDERIGNEIDFTLTLEDYLNTELNFINNKFHILHSDINNKYNANFIILEKDYNYKKENVSNNHYAKYVAYANGIINKSKFPVVINYVEYQTKIDDIINNLFSCGINVYKNFNFIAIDPPIKTNLGFCVFNYNNGDYKIVESGTLKLNRYHYRGQSLMEMYNLMLEKIKTHKCKAMVSESSFGFGVPKIRTLLGENVGLLNFIAEYYNIPFISISPLHFKSIVLGDRNSDKNLTIKWVSEMTGKSGMEEHEADAYTIGIAFMVDRELINLPIQKTV